MAQIESQDYKIIQSFNDVEIRLYSPVMLAKYSSKNSGSGFGKLFRYISGNNSQNIKIAMTTPVHMERGEISSMAFVLPKKFSKNNAPLPIDKSVDVFEKETSIPFNFILFGIHIFLLKCGVIDLEFGLSLM